MPETESPPEPTIPIDEPPKSPWAALAYVICFGAFGAHRFYIKDQRAGLIMLALFFVYALPMSKFMLFTLAEWPSLPDWPSGWSGGDWYAAMLLSMPFTYPFGSLVELSVCPASGADSFATASCVSSLLGLALTAWNIHDALYFVQGRLPPPVSFDKWTTSGTAPSRPSDPKPPVRHLHRNRRHH